MARAGDTLRMGNDRLTFHKTSADTGGSYVEVEVDYGPVVNRPPVHTHPKQREHMRILSGELLVVMDGEESVYAPGEIVDIPPGVKHTLWNPGTERTVVRWRTSPALRTERVFETLWSLSEEGKLTPDGRPTLQVALLALAFRNEYRVSGPRPFAVDMALCTLLAPLGLACGYRFTHRRAANADRVAGS
ncbi:cupin domain-containing protein [Embleya sp. NBC_00896]|uniref:cupin domain-containing protein n=1 Tax=Embleya sp. NBC_00896 TaxID=2975961 RepID=UPI00386C494A|nr:cupin domain-containing protein [Embleya sp. NBC_00896]